jgi:predicted transcriptional regulator
VHQQKLNEQSRSTIMEGTVEQIMTRQVLTLAPDAALRDAAWGLTISGIAGAPVKDVHGHVIGVLSKSDLADPVRSESGPHETVADAMTPILFAIRSSASVMDAVCRMVQTGAHRLVVIDDDGHLAGIVTPMDVLKEMVRRHRYGEGRR